MLVEGGYWEMKTEEGLVEKIKSQLENTIDKTNLGFGKRYEGKVRDSYFLDDRIIMIATDRISAFDKVLGTIPFKGQLLNQLSAFWFNETRNIVQNHLVDVPDPNTSIVKRYYPLPLEIIVRGHVRNSNGIWSELDKPVVTPSTKAERGFHDEPITKYEIIEKKILTKKEFSEVEYVALELFKFGKNLTYKRDKSLTLLDTKYEFARDSNGNLVLIDEIHTPDSSRTRGQFDKEFLRLWLKERGYNGESLIPYIPNEIKIQVALRYVKFYEEATLKNFNFLLKLPKKFIRGSVFGGIAGGIYGLIFDSPLLYSVISGAKIGAVTDILQYHYRGLYHFLNKKLFNDQDI